MICCVCRAQPEFFSLLGFVPRQPVASSAAASASASSSSGSSAPLFVLNEANSFVARAAHEFDRVLRAALSPPAAESTAAAATTTSTSSSKLSAEVCAAVRSAGFPPPLPASDSEAGVSAPTSPMPPVGGVSSSAMAALEQALGGGSSSSGNKAKGTAAPLSATGGVSERASGKPKKQKSAAGGYALPPGYQKVRVFVECTALLIYCANIFICMFVFSSPKPRFRWTTAATKRSSSPKSTH
jgi:hypothetical protein